MRTLRVFLLGAVAGVIVGGAGPAFAVLGWVGGSALARADRNFQLGYVAGVDDAVQTITSDRLPMSAVTRQAACLAKHHSSLGLKAFGDWALALPQGEPENAARLIIGRACGGRMAALPLARPSSGAGPSGDGDRHGI
jgi:hypothetical protein